MTHASPCTTASPPLRASPTSVTALSAEAAPAPVHGAPELGFGAAARGRTARIPISS